MPRTGFELLTGHSENSTLRAPWEERQDSKRGPASNYTVLNHRDRNDQANGPFQAGRIRKMDDPYDPNLYDVSFGKTPSGQVSDNLYNADSDVRLAQTYLNQYYYGNDRGNNITRGDPGTYKNYEAAANKVALKKALAESISGAPKNLEKEVGLLRGDAGEALGTGLNQTRKNFNDRGLLYSGMREGGEQSVRGRVASALAQSETEARRESANLVNQRKAAFAAIGLAEQEAKNKMAQEAFEKSYQNNIARRQAMQRLGSGVGQVAGYYYGSNSGNAQDTQAQTPTYDNEPMAGGSYTNYSGVA